MRRGFLCVGGEGRVGAGEKEEGRRGRVVERGGRGEGRRRDNRRERDRVERGNE